ncbi:MAG: hypothetical protein ACR2K1_04870 [Saprospiraceae bacterium]
MEDSQFDKILKAGLEGLDTPYDVRSWEALAKKLDARQPAEPSDVDAAVLRRLQSLEATFDPADWAAMERRLVQERRKRGVLWIKISEAALLLLLLGYLSGFPGDQSARPARPINPTQGQVAAQSVVAPAAQDKTTIARAKNTRRATLNRDIDAPYRGINTPNRGDAMHRVSTSTGASDRPIPVAISCLPADLQALAGPVAPFLADRPFFPPPAQPAPARRGFYAGALAAAEWNRIVSGDYQHRAAGNSVGFSAGYRWKKWGVETGLQYASRQYQPARSVTLFDGSLPNRYYGTNLHTVAADLLSIPVRATRLAWTSGKLEAHVVAGGAAHLALQKSYEYETLVFTGQPPSGLPVLAPDQQAQLRPKAQGLLQGGRLHENAYLTVDLGLRLQYPLSAKYTVFVEPAVRQALGRGIGPKAGKLNTAGLNVGVWKQL